jgi:hypothetical protein
MPLLSSGVLMKLLDSMKTGVIVGTRPLLGHHPLVTRTPDPSTRAKLASPYRGDCRLRIQV